MKSKMQALLLGTLISLAGTAYAEFKPSDHDGFQRPKEKNVAPKKESVHKKSVDEIDHDGVKVPKPKPVPHDYKNGVEEHHPENNKKHDYHEQDGFKRPKKQQ